MMVEEIMDYDNQVMNELIAIREQIETENSPGDRPPGAEGRQSGAGGGQGGT